MLHSLVYTWPFITKRRKQLISVSFVGLSNLPISLNPTHFAVLGTEELPTYFNLPCGVVAGILASGVTQPADVVKTKLQTKVAQGLTTRQVFVDIVKVN